MYETTLKDIAQKTGYSVNTVSLALKNSPRISETARERIQQIAKEMHYVSNNMARALVLKRTGTIGLILRNISSMLLATQARYIEQYLESKGYTMYIIASHDDADMERKALGLMLSNKVDGLIINTKFTENLPQLEALRAKGFPIVLLSGFLNPPALDAVFPDLRRGAYILTKHLLGLGRKRIAFVTGDPCEDATRNLKMAGYRQALAEADIPYDHKNFRLTTPNRFFDSAGESLSQLLSFARQDTALFITEDEMAIPIAKFLIKNGVDVPRELPIGSMDNIRFAESAIVSLTTVGFNLQYISHRAVDILLDLMQAEEPPAKPQIISAEPQLFIRESCGYLNL